MRALEWTDVNLTKRQRRVERNDLLAKVGRRAAANGVGAGGVWCEPEKESCRVPDVLRVKPIRAKRRLPFDSLLRRAWARTFAWLASRSSRGMLASVSEGW